MIVHIAYIQVHQDLGRSYKEVCAPVIERCHFLFNELRPAIGNEVSALSRSKLLKSTSKWKAAVSKVIGKARKEKGRFLNKSIVKQKLNISYKSLIQELECCYFHFLELRVPQPSIPQADRHNLSLPKPCEALPQDVRSSPKNLLDDRPTRTDPDLTASKKSDVFMKDEGDEAQGAKSADALSVDVKTPCESNTVPTELTSPTFRTSSKDEDESADFSGQEVDPIAPEPPGIPPVVDLAVGGEDTTRKEPASDLWSPVVSAVTSAREFKWLRQRLTGAHADMSLMGKIVEFVLYDNPIDIEKLRKSLHHQVIHRN